MSTGDPSRTRRSILLSLAAVLGLAGLAVIASLLIPFNVELPGTIQDITAGVELGQPGEKLSPTLDAAQDQYTLQVGQRLRVPPGSMAAVRFFNQGHAVLSGPLTLTLVESHRRATALGHLADRFNRSYVLTIEQTGGTARYNFANTTPQFEEVDITVRLPGSNYKPAAPCWIITIDVEGNVYTSDTDCR
jgi:hypothetical protein